MQPSTRIHAAMAAPHPTIPAALTPKSGILASKKVLLPTLAWFGAAYVVGSYVHRQLHRESGSLDHIFAQQNTPEVEQARKRDLQTETLGDPRNSLLNVLGWTK